MPLKEWWDDDWYYKKYLYRTPSKWDKYLYPPILKEKRLPEYFNTYNTAYLTTSNYTSTVNVNINAGTLATWNYYLNTSFNINVAAVNNATAQLNNLNEQLKKLQKAWAPTLTPEQILAAKRKAAAAKAKKTRAINKARLLLLMNLDIRQTLDFEKHGYFFVVGSEGNLYQIRTGRSHNVRLYDPFEMKPIWTLCAHPIEAVPDFDTMVAQKLWLESDEPSFVKMANRGTVYAREQEAAIAQTGNHDAIAQMVREVEAGMAIAV